MKHSLLFLLVAAFIVACTPQENIFAQTTVSKAPGNLIRLEMGGCRGTCPMFKLTFRNNGILEYVGTRNVDKSGVELVRLTAEEFSQLIKEVGKLDLWQYPAEIPSSVADAPVHTYTVFDGEKTHTVKGSVGIPKAILDLEAILLDITEAHNIVVRKPSESKAASALKGQVIVKFRMDVNAKEFCGQFTDLKVRTVSHLSEDNTWVIGYNPKEVTQEQFLSLLKGLDTVLEVEPNKQVTERE